MQKEKIQTYRLKNGLVLVHQQVKNFAISHCGYFIPAGTKNESASTLGIAHLVEHCVFKGTKNRSNKQIFASIDGYGGEVNAYTSKEETVFYASISSQYINKAIDVLTDLVFFPLFKEEEIEKEKTVVIDEIHAYLDSPSELIFDDFEALIFEEHPLGRQVLGSQESVENLSKKDLEDFVQMHYQVDQIIFTYVGNLSFEKVLQALEKYTQEVVGKKNTISSVAYDKKKHKKRKATFKKETHQQHLMMGGLAPSYQEKERFSMHLINSLLGGAGLNNYLHINIREKYGFVYNIESNYHLFQDVGYFSIYFGVEEKYLEKMELLVCKEVQRVLHQNFTEKSFQQLKRQLKGHLLLAQEQLSQLMINNAKTFSIYQKVEPISQVFEQIDAVTINNFQNTANQYLSIDRWCQLIYQ